MCATTPRNSPAHRSQWRIDPGFVTHTDARRERASPASSFGIDDHCWHQLIYRYAASSPSGVAPLEIYLDGNKAASITTGSNDTLFATQVNDIQLGLHHVGSGWLRAHHRADDLLVYDRVFSEAEQCTELFGGTWSGGVCTP